MSLYDTDLENHRVTLSNKVPKQIVKVVQKQLDSTEKLLTSYI